MTSKRVDFTGRVFGQLTVVSFADSRRTPNGTIKPRWHCRCNCGGECVVTSPNLVQGHTRSCGCAHVKHNLAGRRFGRLTVVERSGKRWRCRCDCGVEKVIVGHRLVAASVTSCGCASGGQTDSRWIGCGDIPGVFWSGVRRNASKRDIVFKVSIQEAWTLYLAQAKTCALSGRRLAFSSSRKRNETTASLDRIDSAKGYTLDNVQWVHKDVNIMKNDLTQDHFIELCRLIAERSHTCAVAI